MIRVLLAVLTLAQASTSPASSPDEAAYIAAITQRAQKNVAALNLDDAEKAGRVRTLIVQQYRGLREIDSLREQLRQSKGADEVKSAIAEARQERHRMFLDALASELTPAQVDQIKDEMTYHKVQVTYDAYLEMDRGLNDQQKAQVMEFLKQAREEAMDGGSAEEKSAIFKKYKGKINNYLAAQGIDHKKGEKEWSERQNAKSATTQAD